MREAILEILRAGTPLQNIDIRIALRERGFEVKYSGQIDRLLQSLRHDGLISYVKQRWVVHNVKKCETCQGTGFVRHDSSTPPS